MKSLSLLTLDFALGNGLSLPTIQERRLRQVIEIIGSDDPTSPLSDLTEKVCLKPRPPLEDLQAPDGNQTWASSWNGVFQKAAELLKSTNLSIKEVAQGVGCQHHPAPSVPSSDALPKTKTIL
jgi:transcriptional regulator GlxA family with amidase domain